MLIDISKIKYNLNIMIKLIFCIGVIISIIKPSHSVTLKYIDKNELSSENKDTFENFLCAPETENYINFAKKLNILPLLSSTENNLNATLIDSEWLLCSFQNYLQLDNINVTTLFDNSLGNIRGEKIFLADTPNSFVTHPILSLCLIKIKPTTIKFLERLRNPNENTSNLLLSKIIDYYKEPIYNSITPEWVISSPTYDIIEDKVFGNFLELKSKNDSPFVEYSFKEKFNIKVTASKKEIGNPVLALINSNESNILKTLTPYDHLRLKGITCKTDIDSLTIIDITEPEVNGWIDCTILSDALK